MLNTNPERARNRPIVSLEIKNNGKANVPFDTGCDCNVVDYSFFKRLAKLDKTFKIVPEIDAHSNLLPENWTSTLTTKCY